MCCIRFLWLLEQMNAALVVTIYTFLTGGSAGWEFYMALAEL